MRRAIALSREGVPRGGGPFGAVVALGDRIVGEGSNMVTSSRDPTAHAEIVAIRAACATLARFELRGCEIFTSCEPCPMCLGAIHWARLDRVYYGNDRQAAAQIGFDDAAIYREVALPMEARKLSMTRLLEEEARAAFEEWERLPDRVRY
jgi:tRNA(Arg) A34 adenosine deaminase TadA